MTNELLHARVSSRAATRAAIAFAAAVVLAALGCVGTEIPTGDTSLDGSWRVTVFPPGVAGGQEIGTVVISGGSLEKLTGIPGIPANLAALGVGDIPLKGNTINLFNLVVITGNGSLTFNEPAIRLDVEITGSVTGQALSFSASLDGDLISDGVIEGTATLNGALFGGSSFSDPNASIEFSMVRL